ncbi:hypothetical protein B0T25DRAFT_511238 [Lasiosphaeria hispida]|uniref:Uncharacterized protein n=1 Tax=Lasiosphaeria hispida TaxID=260671 RepID=A0AAJ0H705_9PEZI|nr:hypothetical protein B0T25DRAFT_511238 [Lasiosphaeria hispida]
MAARKRRVYPASESSWNTNENPPRVKRPDNDHGTSAFIERIMRFALASPDRNNDGDVRSGDDDHEEGDEMPQFGALSFYHVEDGDRDYLWKLEAQRLTAAARGPPEHLVFPSDQASATIDKEGFVDIAKLAETILCALHVCSLDDQAVLDKFGSRAFDETRWSRVESALRNRVASHDLPGQAHGRSRSYARERRSSYADQGWDGTPTGDIPDLYAPRGAMSGGLEVNDGNSPEPRNAGIVLESDVFQHLAKGVRSDVEADTAVPKTDSDTLEDMEGPRRSTSSQGTAETTSDSPSGKGPVTSPPPLHVIGVDDRESSGRRRSVGGERAKEVKFNIPEGPPQKKERAADSANHKLGQVSSPERYFALIDHLTAVLGHIATQRAASSYWRTVVLAILAKLSTKLKVLAMDLPDFAHSCLGRGRDISRIKGRLSSPDRSNFMPSEGDVDEMQGFGEWQFPRISDDDASVSRYCLENATVSRWLGDCLTHALVELGARRPLYAPLDRMDVCAMVFRSGTKGVPTLMHQDRHANIGGSSDGLPLVFSGSAVLLAIELVTRFEIVDPPPVGGKVGDGKGTARQVSLQASWEQSREDGSDVDVERSAATLAAISDVVTVLVPLAFAKPSLGEGFRLALQAMSALSAFGEIVPSPTRFTALVSLRLEPESSRHGVGGDTKFRQKRLRLRGMSFLDTAGIDPNDAKPLSQSFLTHKRLNLFDRSTSIVEFGTDKVSVKETIMGAEAKLEEMRRQTREWEIDGGAVVVKCPVYVWSVLSCCALLVTGGLLSAFLIGDRIEGVDPFNIATFTWVIAAFILLIAKSVRVSDWPWRDFLLGRVTCCSLTELRSVTGMDPQDMIAFFLSTSTDNRLLSRGPFNTAFFRNAGWDGFSIDVKPELQTLLACGVIPLKVTMLRGPSLICLDLSPGRYRLTSADHSMRDSNAFDRALCCLDLPSSKDDADAPLVVGRRLSWIKILGLYNCIGRKFK